MSEDEPRLPGRLVYRVIDGDSPVGWLWLAVPGPDDPTTSHTPRSVIPAA